MRRDGGRVDMESSHHGHTVDELLGFTNHYREFVKGYADKAYPMQQLMLNKGKKFEWNDKAQASMREASSRHAY